MWLGESACGTAMHRPVGRGCGSLEKRVLAIGIDDDVPPAVALAAAKDGLDCAGISTKSTVELDISVKLWNGFTPNSRQDHAKTIAAVSEPRHGQTTVKIRDVQLRSAVGQSITLWA
jgi:hypothetical protein